MQDQPKDKGSSAKHLYTRNLSGHTTDRDMSIESASSEQVIPVISEKLKVHKRNVETGKGVRVRKTLSEREQIVDQPLVREEVTVERVEINEVIEDSEIPTTRYEGETTIVPILEEILIIEKCTVLKGEVRITRHRREVREPQKVVLQTDEVSVERFDESVDAPVGNTGERD